MSDDVEIDPVQDDGTAERARDLLERARELVTDHPELSTVLDRLDALDDVDLSRHPEVFDEAHQALRRALAGAGRPDTPIPGT